MGLSLCSLAMSPIGASKTMNNPFTYQDKEQLARSLGIEVLDCLEGITPPQSLLAKVPYSFVNKRQILPLREKEGKVLIAINDPLDLASLEEIKERLGQEIDVCFCAKELLEEKINLCYDPETGAASHLLDNLNRKKKNTDDEEVTIFDLLGSQEDDSAIVKLLHLILTEAIQQGASDIHFEPLETGLRVRYRIDGILLHRHMPDPEYQAQLLARIKVMAKMDIAEHRLPQDGRMKLRLGTKSIDIRASTVPVIGGERIVLRILDKGNVVLGLNRIGMEKDTLKAFQSFLSLPEGIILVTGPTGSGKTTTLYSGLSERKNDATNIMTIEDPVEYNLKGIAQIEVKPKISLTFAKGLRHILRQDPDVIMIGEIRDKETAEIAIQAALTGHLVLSTLHTNDAPSAITRLVDMGIEPYLLSSCLVAVLAQRLVRTLCPLCKEPYTPTKEVLTSLGMHEDNPIFHKAKGCKNCYETGYKGRHGIYELLSVTDTLKQQIARTPDAHLLKICAIKEGMKTLLHHGRHLLLEGSTTVEELLRICKGG
jgi:general secretion pathway protein E